jgi:hypothetical protein
MTNGPPKSLILEMVRVPLEFLTPALDELVAL